MEVVIFVQGTRRYVAELGAVKEVVRLGPITEVPLVPPCVIGATQVSGRVLAVLDLGQLLEGRPVDVRPGAAAIVVEGLDGSAAVLVAGHVDEVTELRSMQTVNEHDGQLVRAVLATEHGTLHWLDVDRVLQRVMADVAAACAGWGAASEEPHG